MARPSRAASAPPPCRAFRTYTHVHNRHVTVTAPQVGGRLVYFLPTTYDTYDPAEVPSHPALELVAIR